MPMHKKENHLIFGMIIEGTYGKILICIYGWAGFSTQLGQPCFLKLGLLANEHGSNQLPDQDAKKLKTSVLSIYQKVEFKQALVCF